jgi:hypothetical protein
VLLDFATLPARSFYFDTQHFNCVLAQSADSLSFAFRSIHQEPPLLWRTFPEDRVTVSEGGAVATQTVDRKFSLMTTDTELTEGKHYWEVELLSKTVTCNTVGISRPNLEPTGAYYQRGCTDGWFIEPSKGALHGNGKECNDAAGAYKQGDRVGVLLDLDNGSLRFFKNGVEHGPGYAAGSVTGPVVHAVQMATNAGQWCMQCSMRLLPIAEAPAGV